MAENAVSASVTIECPFLSKFPREIRDLVYGLVLLNPDIEYVPDREDTYFAVEAAIMFTCRQIYLEAKEAFFSGTEFIVYEVKRECLSPLIPTFKNLTEEAVGKPVLKVTTKPAKDVKEINETEWTTIITNADGIFGIIQTMWTKYLTIPQFGKDSPLVLDFHDNFPSRRLTIETEILLPWIDVQGFKEVSLTGDFRPLESEFLKEETALGPSSLQYIFDPVETLLQKGDSCRDQKQYFLAMVHYKAGHVYGYYRFTTIKHRLQQDQILDIALLANSYSITTVWEEMKLLLLWGNNYREILLISEYLMKMLLKPHHQSVELYHYLTIAKVLISQAMANLALRKHHDATKPLKEASIRLHQYNGGMEQDGVGYNCCYEEMRWAADEYSEELQAIPAQVPRVEPVLDERPTNEFRKAKFGTFWEWLDRDDESLKAKAEHEEKEREETMRKLAD
jgi:hypothetical protein